MKNVLSNYTSEIAEVKSASATAFNLSKQAAKAIWLLLVVLFNIAKSIYAEAQDFYASEPTQAKLRVIRVNYKVAARKARKFSSPAYKGVKAKLVDVRFDIPARIALVTSNVTSTVTSWKNIAQETVSTK